MQSVAAAGDLTPFCSPDRPELNRPFSDGPFSYATNGHVLLRVPRLAGVPDRLSLTARPPNPDHLFANWSLYNNWKPLPSLAVADDAVRVGRSHVQPKYLKLIADFPGVEISECPPDDDDHWPPVAFRFPGGEGLIMPYRVQEDRPCPAVPERIQRPPPVFSLRRSLELNPGFLT